jgi:type I restriction enzyme S subunit
MGRYSKFLIEPPHTVMAAIGAYAGAVRYSPEPSWVNNNAFGLLAKPAVLPGYFYLWLNSKLDLSTVVAGTGQPYVQRPSLNATKVALPPLSDQKRIVDLISSVDDYIAALQQQGDNARSARNAVLHELLSAGGDDWTEKNLGETLDISRGGSPRPIQEFITNREDGVNWVKIGDASNSSKYIYETKEKIKPAGVEKSRKVTSGDFILSNSMSFGRPYIMRCDGCIHDGWLLLGNVATHFNEDFLYNLLMSDHVQKQFNSLAAGSGVRNLNIEAVKGVVVPLPPLSAQQEIASIANTLDEFVWALEATVHDAKRMRQSVLAALLSGEHQVPDTYDRLLGAA